MVGMGSVDFVVDFLGVVTVAVVVVVVDGFFLFAGFRVEIVQEVGFDGFVVVVTVELGVNCVVDLHF